MQSISVVMEPAISSFLSGQEVIGQDLGVHIGKTITTPYERWCGRRSPQFRFKRRTSCYAAAMHWLQSLDDSLFRFINQTRSNSVFDVVMPFLSGNAWLIQWERNMVSV